ncbi:isochorismate synthase [Poseidonocella sedimentorum]|uniref:isochorismate synthase n=1 Tax=Poseidonocella sedimentorum TaxID=871652 RepID=A0A1I6E4P2_9RHOB|nr:isochorismate synthase [Poseidonocella sedimentorum]SFR12438.1 isochorismate synthase [Poseidonocella sedimentorum]
MHQRDQEPLQISRDTGLAGAPLLLGDDYGRVRTVVTAPLADASRVALPAAGRHFGAFPFARNEPGHLYETAPAQPAAPSGAMTTTGRTLDRLPDPAQYGAAVARAAATIRRAPHALEKVVLARALDYRTDAALDPVQIALRLAADRAVTSYAFPLPQGAGAPPRWLVGATPELLLSKTGPRIASHPLAGSIRRQADPAADRAAAQQLLASRKDLTEHRVVVEYIHDLLAPHCRDLAIPASPGLEQTASMWHLGTRIEGRLRDDAMPCLDLVHLLHPTPAVAGHPLAAALETITEAEPFARDFYAGTLGWVDAQNDGAWHVTLRCAIIDGQRARLFAGAGIVGASQPDDEVAETRAKFIAMRSALGISDSL